jgi:hypothetical protein
MIDAARERYALTGTVTVPDLAKAVGPMDVGAVITAARADFGGLRRDVREPLAAATVRTAQAIWKAVEDVPHAAQLHESGREHLRHVLQLHQGSAKWRRAERVCVRDFLEVAWMVWQQTDVPRLVQGGPIGLFYWLLARALVELGRPDLAGQVPLYLNPRHLLPDQQTEVWLRPNGIPVMAFDGPPAEQQKLLPLLRYAARIAGAPQNERGRPRKED